MHKRRLFGKQRIAFAIGAKSLQPMQHGGVVAPARHAAPPSKPEPSGAARPHEPADFYINVFQDNRRHWLNAEAAFTDLSDCFESILDGQRGCAYRYTLHVRRAGDGTRAVSLDDFEPDARAWAAEPDTQESFLYARSAGRRL